MIRKAGISITIAALGAAVSACGVGEAKVAEVAEADRSAPLPVEITLPERTDIFAIYKTTGTLESDADAPVLARVAGEVVEVLVEEGEKVRAGQVLARLDGDRLRFEMLEAKANLDRVVGEYERLLKLHERGLVSEAMYDGLAFDIDSLRASYELKKLNYDYTTIRAPIDGVISSRDIKLGRHVTVNAPAFRITDSSRLVAHLKIPQSELQKFSSGLALSLSVDAMPETMFAADISRISPTIDVETGTFRATAYIDNGTGGLAPGMFARFSIAYETHRDALVIPADALVREDNIAAVYVVNNGSAERRIIETGIESNGKVEVLSGLDAAESVVVTGKAGLSDGSRVLASNDNIRITG